MKEYNLNSSLRDHLAADFPGKDFREDAELKLYDKFVSLVEDGKKVTTVRYAKDKVRLPKFGVLGLHETKATDPSYQKLIGAVQIDKLVVKSFNELTDEDGQRDGFANKQELVDVIEGIYGKVAPEELVSIYHIKLV